jgi:hypothetical protein
MRGAMQELNGSPDRSHQSDSIGTGSSLNLATSDVWPMGTSPRSSAASGQHTPVLSRVTLMRADAPVGGAMRGSGRDASRHSHPIPRETVDFPASNITEGTDLDTEYTFADATIVPTTESSSKLSAILVAESGPLHAAPTSRSSARWVVGAALI